MATHSDLFREHHACSEQPRRGIGALANRVHVAGGAASCSHLERLLADGAVVVCVAISLARGVHEHLLDHNVSVISGMDGAFRASREVVRLEPCVPSPPSITTARTPTEPRLAPYAGLASACARP